MDENEQNNEEIIYEKNSTSGFKRSLTKQVVLGLLTNFINVAPSMSLGFSAVALPALTAISNPHALSQDEASWFASIAPLATPFGCLLCGPIADRFGRKTSLFWVNVIGVIGWLIIALAYYCSQYQYVILLIGRVLTGLSTGLSSTAATVYMAEISSPKLRAVFCSWSTVSFSIGVLAVYFYGFIFKDNWGLIALVTTVFPLIGLVFVVSLVPESPSWLIRKDRYDQAKINMCKIFGTKAYIPEVQKEIQILINSKGTKDTTKQKTLLEQFVNKIMYLIKPNALKPFGLMTAFFFFQQFSGTFVLVFYAIDIVKAAGVTTDPYITLVLIGFVRMIGAILVSYFSKIFGRRPLSMISGSGMTICMISLAGYIVAIMQGKISKSTEESMVFLPLTLLLLYFFISTLGFLPMPFVMSAEVFPAKIRGTATSLTSSMGYLFNFITVKMYMAMVNGIGRQGLFFFYGALSLVGTIFVYACLPETKGKSLTEIEEHFGKKQKKTHPLLKNSHNQC